MNKKLYFLTIAATLVMILINALANILPINGITTGAVSDQFKVFFVPSGYVFSIWGVIYLLLLAFSFGYPYVMGKQASYDKKIVPLYVLSAALNCLWIVLWHYNFFLTTVVVMLGLLITLARIYGILKENPPKTIAEKLIVHLPFWVYLAWICVATIANVSAILWLVGWNGFGIPGATWAAIMMVVAAALATYVTLTTVDFAFALVVIWALVGIVVKFPTESVMQYAGGFGVGLITVVWLYKRIVPFLKKK